MVRSGGSRESSGVHVPTRSLPPFRLAVLLVASVLVMVAGTPAALAAPAPEPLPHTAQQRQIDSAAQELADRYAPILYLRNPDDEICNPDREGFEPVPVNFVLGQPDIPLVQSANGEPDGPRRVVAELPTAADLYQADETYFLNYPGTPFNPQCVYRESFAARKEGVPNVAYAHIYVEPDQAELALQYWFYYYFNDWNNDHEGDWEMVMLIFDATTVEEALQQEPARVIYAQHGGGERASWDANKLTLEAGRPVVYVARGAHASQYEPKVYLGLAENGTGFGCETAKGPHRRVEVQPIVIPHEPSGPDDPFAWLAYDGRWGELARSEWNGPTGPNTKTSWREPISWSDGVRDTSLVVPEFGGLGQAPVDVFCGAVAAGSSLLAGFARAPVLTIGFIIVVIVAIGWITSYASPSIRLAYGFYRGSLRTFVLVGAVLIPTGAIVAGLQTLIFGIPPVEPFLAIVERFPGIKFSLALALGSVQLLVAVTFVAPALVWAIAEVRAGRRPGWTDAFRQGMRFVRPLIVARVRGIARVLVRALTIVGAPWAILQAIRLSYLDQAVVLEGVERRAAIVTSGAVADRDITRTVVMAVVLNLIVILTGPIVAIVLLLAIPARPIALLNIVSSLLFAVLYPLSIIGMTLLYFDLRDNEQTQRDPQEGVAPEPIPQL